MCSRQSLRHDRGRAAAQELLAHRAPLASGAGRAWPSCACCRVCRIGAAIADLPAVQRSAPRLKGGEAVRRYLGRRHVLRDMASLKSNWQLLASSRTGGGSPRISNCCELPWIHELWSDEWRSWLESLRWTRACGGGFGPSGTPGYGRGTSAERRGTGAGRGGSRGAAVEHRRAPGSLCVARALRRARDGRAAGSSWCARCKLRRPDRRRPVRCLWKASNGCN